VPTCAYRKKFDIGPGNTSPLLVPLPSSGAVATSVIKVKTTTWTCNAKGDL